MKDYIIKYWLVALGIAVSAIGGYMYWLFVGCNSGTCPITSSPINSSLWGATMGGLLFSYFKKTKKE